MAPKTSLVAQIVKYLPIMWETRFHPWVGKILWRRKWQPIPVLLPGKSRGQSSLVSYSPWGSHRTKGLHFHFFTFISNCGGVNEDNGNLLQKVPCMYCYTQRPQTRSRPPQTHASAGDSWTLPGTSGSVSCGVTAPFSLVLVH